MGESIKENGKKRKSLTLEDRIKIIERLSAGERQVDIADKLNISPSTVASIYRRKNTILKVKEVVQSCGGNLQMKKCRGTNFINREAELYNWFIQRRNAGLPVTGYHLQKKALEFNKEERDDGSKFKASNGWLHKFKKRKGIRSLVVHREKKTDTLASEKFKAELNNFIKLSNNSLDFIYNCDETGLEWKQLPTKTQATRNEKSTVEKKQINNKITVMNCTNASGSHKIPLYIIGSANQAHCLQGVRHLPVHYDNQQKICMDRELMLKWYKDIFLPEVQKKHDYDKNPNIRIILIMDNAPFHPPPREFDAISKICTVLFLPTNVTSLIQPLNQGINVVMKMNYKKLFLSHIYAMRTDNNIELALKSFSLLDAVKYCAKAWDNISPNSIRNCWKHLIPLDNSTDSIEENIDLDFHSFLTKFSDFSFFSVEETLQYLNCDNLSNDSELENSSDSEDSTNQNDMIQEFKNETNTKLPSEISLEKGFDSLTNFIKYYERNEDCCQSTLQMLEAMSQNMIEKIISQKYPKSHY